MGGGGSKNDKVKTLAQSVVIKAAEEQGQTITYPNPVPGTQP